MDQLQNKVNSLKDYLGCPVDLITDWFEFPQAKSERAVFVYLRSITDLSLIDERIITNFTKAIIEGNIENKHLKDQPATQSIMLIGNRINTELSLIADYLFRGFCIVLVDYLDEGIAVNAANWSNRSVTPPEKENSIIGAKDSFIEDIMVNLSMIRRRVHSKDLRVEEFVVGEQSQTKLMFVYMEGLVNQNALNQCREKLQQLRFDVILDTTQLGLDATEQRFSPFPLYQLTIRPDKSVSAIMSGRFLLLMDTTPSVLILPVTLTSLYETPDDYYFSDLGGIFLRMIRLLGLSITLFLPALYIAITSVNQDMFREQFMLAVSASREGVPYPAYVEVVIMLLLVELIDEATVRLPSVIGNTATIVGGLIIGTAAAQAHLISFIMIVITATTAIGSYTAPNYLVGSAWRLCSFILVLLAIPLGLYGLVLGSGFIGMYLCNLSSFGVPYTAPFGTFRYKDLFRDALTISTINMRKFRPSTYSKQANHKRVPSGGEDSL